jgi:hypothetical protein
MRVHRNEFQLDRPELQAHDPNYLHGVHGPILTFASYRLLRFVPLGLFYKVVLPTMCVGDF